MTREQQLQRAKELAQELYEFLNNIHLERLADDVEVYIIEELEWET